jgi:phosphate transport system protein
MLALYQPTAGDMRFITSCMKINSDLERMGDLAVNMAERAMSLNEVAPLKPFIDIPRMGSIAQEMVRTALDSLVTRDAISARRVCERDDEVDQLNDQMTRELISFMLEDRANIKRALDLILVARHLERIADHATNVAEDVIYLVQAKDIRHHRG